VLFRSGDGVVDLLQALSALLLLGGRGLAGGGLQLGGLPLQRHQALQCLLVLGLQLKVLATLVLEVADEGLLALEELGALLLNLLRAAHLLLLRPQLALWREVGQGLAHLVALLAQGGEVHLLVALLVAHDLKGLAAGGGRGAGQLLQLLLGGWERERGGGSPLGLELLQAELQLGHVQLALQLQLVLHVDLQELTPLLAQLLDELLLPLAQLGGDELLAGGLDLVLQGLLAGFQGAAAWPLTSSTKTVAYVSAMSRARSRSGSVTLMPTKLALRSGRMSIVRLATIWVRSRVLRGTLSCKAWLTRV
jgi:hypothetical protein